MAVTLELKPEFEERIIAKAKARGLSVDDYIQRLKGKPTPQDPNALPIEEWKKAFLEWVHTERPEHPPLSDEALSRESIYREREDAQL